MSKIYRNYKDDLYYEYIQEINKYPLLERNKEKELLIKIKNGDNLAKQEFVKSNLRLVVFIANKYYSTRLSIMDLIQEGNVGLLIAIDKIDIEKFKSFASYASYWIKKTIINSLSKNDEDFKYDSNSYGLIQRFRYIYKKLIDELNREPSEMEIAQEMNLSINKVRKLMSLNIPVFRLDDTCYFSNKDNNDVLLLQSETIEDIMDIKYLKNDMRILLDSSNLTEKEIQVIELLYGIKDGKVKTQEELVHYLGYSKSYISKLKYQALSKMFINKKIISLVDYANKPDIIRNKIELESKKVRGKHAKRT